MTRRHSFRNTDALLNEPPFVLIYDPETRIVPRIVDGRRELASLLRP